MPAPRKILVRGPNWIGDQVMARPAYLALRAAYPEVPLTLVVPEALAGVSYPELFAETVLLTPAERRFPQGVVQAARRLRRGFDLGVCFPASFSAAALLWGVGIPVRAGFSRAGSDIFLTAALPWRGRASLKHKATLYREMVEWLSGSHVRPTQAPAVHRPENLIVLAPGASIALREWPYFPELIAGLRARYPAHRLVVVGSAGDGRWHARLKRWGLDGKVEDWVGKTALSELRSLCARAALVVANDSGVAHVAATLAGAPTLVLFGPGDPQYVRPLGKVAIARVSDLPCSPCESARCRAPYGYQRCLRDLSWESVLQQASRLIDDLDSGLENAPGPRANKSFADTV